MELTHTFTVPAPIDRVWETFMDLEQVGGCFPGATVTSVEDDSFTGSVKVKLGPIAMVYKGSGKFVERDDAARHAKIEAKGKDKRGNGTAGANVSVQLTEDSDGTRAEVVTDLSITGKPAQFGRGVMQDVSDKLLAQFVACIEQRLAGPEEGASPKSESGASTDDGSSGPSAAGVAGAGAAGAAGAAATGSTRPAETPDESTSPPIPAASTATPRHAAPKPPEDDALDLGGAMGPVMAKQAAPFVGGLVALVLGGWLFKRLRRRKRQCTCG